MLNNDSISAFPVSVQNGSMHQKDTVHDNDFEPYLTGQSNQVRNFVVLCYFYYPSSDSVSCSPLALL